MSDSTSEPIDRRTVLSVAGAVGAAGVLAACSSGGSSSSAPSPGSSQKPDAGTGGQTIATKSEVPVGGGVVVADKMVVVTQPKAGQFKAFTSTCPHQGCTVSSVTDDVILCPCHGSEFSAESGDVLRGPAMTGLTPVAITVEGDSIVAQT
ncbi:MAG: Rieske (2Fe-2S) protein [Candidatus Nanopelagicales bacterium]